MDLSVLVHSLMVDKQSNQYLHQLQQVLNFSKSKAGGNNQNEILFKRGNAMSGAPIINGTNQLPNPPIIVGITKKKIITKACAVTITLYNWLFPPV